MCQVAVLLCKQRILRTSGVEVCTAFCTKIRLSFVNKMPQSVMKFNVMTDNAWGLHAALLQLQEVLLSACL